MVLLWLSLAFILGVILGAASAIPLPLLLGLAFASILSAFPLRGRWRLLTLLLVAGSLGLARGERHAIPVTSSSIAFYAGQQVQIDGVVSAEPDIRDTGINYVIDVRRVTHYGSARSAHGRIQVRTPRSQQLDYGDQVQMTGAVIAPRNSPTLPYRDILARSGISAEMRYPKLLDLGPTSTGPFGWIVRVRLGIERGINAWLPEPEAALLIAITLGAKSATLGDLAPALVSTGLIHIIAISGIKVAIVAGTLYAFLRRFSLRLPTLIGSLAGLGTYVLLTGATVSGIRSAAMWALVFIAVYLGRGTVALVSLAFVAALMVAHDPTLPSDPAFQLTTLGTFAIVAYSSPFNQLFRYVPTPWREALSTTVAAQIGTMPVVIGSFHVLSLTGPLANALVLPLLPLLIMLGFTLGVVSALPHLAAPLGALSYGLLHPVILLARWLAGAGVPTVPSLSPWLSVIYYLIVTGVSVRLLRRANWVPAGKWAPYWLELTLAILLGTGVTVSGVSASGVPDGITWLGSGDAVLVTSHDHAALIDGGPLPFVLLQRLGELIPYGQRTIGLVVVTDPRARNITSLTEVLNHYSVSAVLDVGAEYPSLTYARWRAALDDRHIPVYGLRTGARSRIGSALLQSVGPDSLYPNPADCIGLLRVAFGSRDYLLTGTASRREQTEALFRGLNLHAEVLVAGAPVDTGLVQSVRPDTVMGIGHIPAGAWTTRSLGSSIVSLTH